MLAAVACNKTEMQPLMPPTAEESGLVAITMKVQVPQVELSASTKAVGDQSEDPSIKDIRVAVFGTSGYPQAYALAEPIASETDESPGEYAYTNGDTYYFKVLLPVYDGEAHVHVIANGPETIQFVDMTEDKIMTQMRSENGVGAFWARIVMPDGILTQLDNNGIMQTDDEGNFIPSPETAHLFEDLVLVRNFAEVTLNIEEGAGIYDARWILVNTPTSGSVAPMAAGTYVDNFKDYLYYPKNGRMVTAEMEETEDGPKPVEDEDGNWTVLKTYEGYMISTAVDDAIPDEDDITADASTPLYIYERTYNNTKPTYIMLKAKFGSMDADYTYYRIDLMDENVGGYFPLYRNFKYQFKIHTVGNPGAETPEEAANRNSGGNVSFTPEAQSLTDISDGVSRLYVEYVSKTFVSGGPKTIWVQYVPNVKDIDEDTELPRVNNSSIKVEVKNLGTALKADTPTTIPMISGSQKGYNVYQFEVNDQSSVADLISSLQISANNGQTGENKSTLYREIHLTVLKTMDMELSLVPKQINTGTGINTVLHIALKDTLQESMFPLEFHIEDINHTLNPTGYDGGMPSKAITVPVKTGKSLADGHTNSFYFIRTVNWTDYEPMHLAWIAAQKNGQSTDGIIDFTTEFETISTASATSIYVENEYFNPQHVNLLNSGIYVTPTSRTVQHFVTSVTIDVETAAATTTWTVTGGTGVDVDKTGTQTGTGSFTMTFDENESQTTSVRRTATVTSGGQTINVIITQEMARFSVTPTTQSVSYNQTSATLQVKAATDESWTATVDDENATLSVDRGTGPASLTVTFGPNETDQNRTITVTLTETNSGDTITSVITQRRTPAGSALFDVNNFTINANQRTGEAVSADGYVRINLARIGNNNSAAADGAFTMGYRANRTTNRGQITITPVDNAVRITGIVITYSNSTTAAYDFGTGNNANTVSVTPGNYIRSGATGTWTGSSTGTITFTNGNAYSQNNYSFPVITNISVTYEPI